jgi:hypothetical protein
MNAKRAPLVHGVVPDSPQGRGFNEIYLAGDKMRFAVRNAVGGLTA